MILLRSWWNVEMVMELGMHGVECGSDWGDPKLEK